MVALDDRYYQLYDAMIQRFPYGAPSLLQCDELKVQGDVLFGKDVSVTGRVEINHEGGDQLCIPDGTTLQ